MDLEQFSDAELLERSADDPAAFAALYERWVEKMLAYFYRRTWDGEVAADLTAETFAIAFTKRRRFVRTAAPGGAWLYGIASRELKRYRRRAMVEQRALRKLGIEPPAVDDESLRRIEELDEVTELRGAVIGALSTLSEMDREAVRLRVVAELPFKEVAASLGCSEGAARVRVHRALGKVASVVEAQHE
ncbi:MAG: RNA polymerase sigma factor [Actinomycetota bacterium]